MFSGFRLQPQNRTQPATATITVSVPICNPLIEENCKNTFEIKLSIISSYNHFKFMNSTIIYLYGFIEVTAWNRQTNVYTTAYTIPYIYVQPLIEQESRIKWFQLMWVRLILIYINNFINRIMFIRYLSV